MLLLILSASCITMGLVNAIIAEGFPAKMGWICSMMGWLVVLLYQI